MLPLRSKSNAAVKFVAGSAIAGIVAAPVDHVITTARIMVVGPVVAVESVVAIAAGEGISAKKAIVGNDRQRPSFRGLVRRHRAQKNQPSHTVRI